MKRYGAYKTSKEYWIEQIPSHWNENYIQQISEEKCEKNMGNQVGVVLSLSYGNIIRKKDVNSGLIAKDLATYQIVEPNDIILRFTDLQNDHRSLRTGLVKENGIITSAYTCIVAKINPSYLHYVLHAYDVRKIFYGMGGGVRQSIGFKDIRYMYVPVPPRTEQDQIVRYLDWKVSEINQLVELKNKQIADLQELKIVRINAILKSETTFSKTVRLKNIARSCGRIGFRGYGISDIVPEHEGAITMSPSNILDDSLDFEKCTYLSWNKYEESPEIQLSENDILMVKTGSSYGKTGFIEDPLPEKATINPQLLIIRGDENEVYPKFLYFYIKYGTIQDQIYRNVIGSTIPTISESTVMSFYLQLPSINKQKDIVYKIQDLVNQSSSLIKLLKREIEILKEYKERLIADVVTGQIDVRDIEIPEYEYVEAAMDIDSEKTDEFEEVDEEV